MVTSLPRHSGILSSSIRNRANRAVRDPGPKLLDGDTCDRDDDRDRQCNLRELAASAASSSGCPSIFIEPT
jgi:hypothetical protein